MVGIRAELYDTTGLARLAVLEGVSEVSWLDQLSRPGACSFRIAKDDAKRSMLTDYRIVKFSWNGLTFGHRLSPEQTWEHTDDRGWVTYTGLGLGALLDDAVVYPEFGISRLAEDTRGFGPYSLSGVWRTGDSGWVTPLGVKWSDTTTVRSGWPKAMKKLAPAAYWIAVTNPDTSVAAGTINWARSTFTLTAADDVMVAWTADNYVDMWLDGRIIGEADDNIRGWRKLKRWEGRLPAGTHQLAARFENAENTSGSNPIAFLCVAATLTNEGKPDRVIRKTAASTAWNVHNNVPEPGWFPAQVLHQLMTEAQARDAKGADLLTLGFTASVDSDSVAWATSGTRETWEYPVGTPYGEVAAALAEGRMDWWVNAATMALHAYDRKGANKATGAGAVRLFLPQGLKGYQTRREYARITAVIGKRANGRWKVTTDAAGIASYGRIEAGASVASAGTEGSLTQVSRRILRRSAAPNVDVTISGSALVGPQPGTDYVLGDSILVPAHLGEGHMKARVLGISVAQRGETVEAYPLFQLDGS